MKKRQLNNCYKAHSLHSSICFDDRMKQKHILTEANFCKSVFRARVSKYQVYKQFAWLTNSYWLFFFLFVYAFLCDYVTDVGAHILCHFCCLTFLEYIMHVYYAQCSLIVACFDHGCCF